MKNMIKIFENDEFGKVRTVIKDGEPWLVGKDVAEILGYSNTRDALSRHVDTEDKTTVVISDSGSNYKSKTTIINESGFYSLVLSSKMPRAKEFRRWVTAEVLPTIRRTGGYVSNEDMFIKNYLPFLDEPYRDLFRLQMTIINKLNERIRHDQPLVEFANQVSNTDNLIDMNAMAKLAKNGAKRLKKSISLPLTGIWRSGFTTTLERKKKRLPYLKKRTNLCPKATVFSLSLPSFIRE